MKWRKGERAPSVKAKTWLSAGKVFIANFWNFRSVFYIDFLYKRGTINFEDYSELLDKEKFEYSQKNFPMTMTDLIPLFKWAKKLQTINTLPILQICRHMIITCSVSWKRNLEDRFDNYTVKTVGAQLDARVPSFFLKNEMKMLPSTKKNCYKVRLCRKKNHNYICLNKSWFIFDLPPVYTIKKKMFYFYPKTRK